jgi:L-iditol 2-dehydrogenase
VAVGPEVESLQIGDRVALEVGIPCWKCALCKEGRYNICPDMKFRSSAKIYPHFHGTLMEFTNHPERMCHRLPDSVSFTGGALAEPLAVCIHAIRRSNPPTRELVELAQSVGQETAALVFGAGAIGLLLASALATTENFTSIVIADIDAARMEIAKSLGLGLKTTQVLRSHPSNKPPLSPNASNSEQTANALENARAVASMLKEHHNIPHGFSRVYECTGVPTCMQAGIFASAAGGALVQIGMGTPVQTLPISAAALREVDLLGVFRYDGLAYPAAISLLASGKLAKTEEIIVTHRLKLVGEGQGEKAFTLSGKGLDENGKAVVKVIIEC